jgi:hypothetical protein
MTMNWGPRLGLPPPSEDNYPKNPLKQEPYYSLQVMTFQNWTRPSAWQIAGSASQEPTRQPAWPRLLTPPVMRPTRLHLWLDCLTMYNFVPCPQIFCLFKPYSSCLYHRDGWGWAECLLCLFPWHVPSRVINLLFLPLPCLFIWHLGAGGQI